ncbi:hypothetical protein GCM10025789_14790 [Tessaracoccus lubricantis]|uniref:Major facilitator superfamily (MFS) profile domain-containing protein n=1 Tax=Tessaracoccus lubricantis TaxID=545543 RepID=A0ABP9FBK1_9ACTN
MRPGVMSTVMASLAVNDPNRLVMLSSVSVGAFAVVTVTSEFLPRLCGVVGSVAKERGRDAPLRPSPCVISAELRAGWAR